VLDVLGILFSGVMMLIVIFRAVQLDRTQPWFAAAPPDPEPAPAKPDRSATRFAPPRSAPERPAAEEPRGRRR
jgi:hypothetical protein